MELVGAGLVDDVQHAAETAPVFGRIVRTEDLEFLDGVDRRKHRDAGEAIHRRERGGHPVDDRIHHRRPRTVHRIAHRVVVVADRAGDAWRQEDQGVDVARIQRQLEDAPVVDDLADRARVRLEQRGVGPDFNLIGELTDLQREVDDDRGVDLHGNVRTRRAAETLQTRFHTIHTRRQWHRDVSPFDVRRRGLRSSGLLIGDGDVGGRYHGAARVLERADDRSGVGLTEQGRREHDEHDTQQGPNQAHGYPPDRRDYTLCSRPPDSFSPLRPRGDRSENGFSHAPAVH